VRHQRRGGITIAQKLHTERNHQGLGNRLIIPPAGGLVTSGSIERQQRLGGMLNYYYRAAA
jgi:hypothetical protein